MTTILIVDDDVGIRSLVADDLTQHGFTIQAARDGGEMRHALLCGLCSRPTP